MFNRQYYQNTIINQVSFKIWNCSNKNVASNVQIMFENYSPYNYAQSKGEIKIFFKIQNIQLL